MVEQSSKDEFEHVTEVYIPQTAFQPDNIPDALKELPRWVTWALVKTNRSKPDDKPTKRPVRKSHTNPYKHKIDIAKWSTPDRQYTFDHCLQILQDSPSMAGLGFIPHPDDGVVVIDYDNLFIDNNISPGDPRLKHINKASDETFVEYSQSGNGAHIFLFGELDSRHNDSAGSGVEIYPGKKQSFIAMTGVPYNDAPSVVNTDQELIDAHVKEFFKKSNRSSNSSNHNNSDDYNDSRSEEYSGYEIPEHIPNGNRNNELTRLCGFLFSTLQDAKEVAARMFVHNQELCETPVSTEELQSIINSIGSRHNAKYKHLIDNIYHIRATNTWYDFNDSTELTANSLDISHIKEFPGKKGSKPLISKWLANQPGFNQAADFTWSPLPYGDSERTIEHDGRKLLNTWKGYTITPRSGDVQPWLDHLDHLIPEADYRRALLWWIAFTIQNPHIKVNWQPIILGVSGAGKDALFRPIATILGNAFKSIGNRDIKGDYDDGLYQTKLLHISEAKGLSGQAIEFYKRITATESSVMQILNIKGKAKVIQHNICNVLVITNNLDAMKFSRDERRAFVLRSPKIMTEEQQTAYFDNWLEKDGPEILFDYLLNYDLSEYKPGIRPYKTIHFDSLFEITQSDVEIQLEEVLESFNAALPDHLRRIVGGDDKYGLAKIKVWLESNGWKRWDDGDSNKRIKRRVGGAHSAPKSRHWYVRIGSEFDGCSPTEMCIEVERIEDLMVRQYKF